MSQAAVFTHADGKFPFCLADKQASAHTHTEREHIKGRRVSFSEKPVSTYLLRMSCESYERREVLRLLIYTVAGTHRQTKPHTVFFFNKKRIQIRLNGSYSSDMSCVKKKTSCQHQALFSISCLKL